MQHSPINATNNRFPAKISEQIWNMKYRFRDPDTADKDGNVIPGAIHDLSVEDTWRRIAKDLAKVEKDPEIWEEEFYKALEDFKYLPAGRITAGAGTARSVTLFNCFVMGTVPDSMGGIFDMLKEAALTMQQGGGIGYDFSTIRPKGAPVIGVGSDASGPLSFMDVWDAMCRTIMSAGSRRGAMMATMRCDHPDVEDFITAKQDAGRLRMFNLSVLISDPFMAAVKENADWDLVWNGEVIKTVKAAELWDKIMSATFGYAEPGVIFVDRINQRNPLRYLETICATNPCGEQPLPPYGACLLGSINLARLISDPFADTAAMDEDMMEVLVARAVRMMDNVVDLSFRSIWLLVLIQVFHSRSCLDRIGLASDGDQAEAGNKAKANECFSHDFWILAFCSSYFFFTIYHFLRHLFRFNPKMLTVSYIYAFPWSFLAI